MLARRRGEAVPKAVPQQLRLEAVPAKCGICAKMEASVGPPRLGPFPRKQVRNLEVLNILLLFGGKPEGDVVKLFRTRIFWVLMFGSSLGGWRSIPRGSSTIGRRLGRRVTR